MNRSPIVVVAVVFMWFVFGAAAIINYSLDDYKVKVYTHGDQKFVEYLGVVCAYVGEATDANKIICDEKARMLKTFHYLDAEAAIKK